MTADALLKWATFPVDQRPRPLVLTGNPVQVQGFKTSDGKIAFLTGHVRSDVALPAGVLDRLWSSRQLNSPLHGLVPIAVTGHCLPGS